MGGGRSRKPETRKSAVLSPRAEPIRGGGGGGIDDLELPLCERRQEVVFKFDADVEAKPGEVARIARGDPPFIVIGGKAIGWVSNRRQAQTLAACLDAGYLLSGEIRIIDGSLREGIVVVVGVRASP